MHRDLFEAADSAEKRYSVILLKNGGKLPDESIDEDASRDEDNSDKKD